MSLQDAKVGDIVLLYGNLVRRIVAADKTKITIFVNPEIPGDTSTESWSRKTGKPVGCKDQDEHTIKIITMAEAMQYLT